MRVSSTDDTCLVRTSSARYRTGQNAASSRLAGRFTAGALLSTNGVGALDERLPIVFGQLDARKRERVGHHGQRDHDGAIVAVPIEHHQPDSAHGTHRRDA